MTTIRWILSLLALLGAGCATLMMDDPPDIVDDPPSKRIKVPRTLNSAEILWEGTLWKIPIVEPFTTLSIQSSILDHQKINGINKEEILEYQKAHNLVQTGQLDDTTMKALVETWKRAAGNPPIISIGRPKIWPLPMVLPPEKMSPLIQTRMKEVDFYLIQLFCSFRPTTEESWIETARFNISLLPDLMGRQPIALDLIPMQITEEVKQRVKFTLAPTLKFHEVEAQGGTSSGVLNTVYSSPLL